MYHEINNNSHDPIIKKDLEKKIIFSGLWYPLLLRMYEYWNKIIMPKHNFYPNCLLPKILPF